MAISKSLNQLLKSMTTVHRGDDVYEVASSDRINSIQDAIRLITRGDNIVSGPNILKKTGEAYCTLSAQVRQGFGGGGDTTETPFHVISRTNPDTGDLELGVISNSHLFDTEDRDIYEEPNDDWGLLSDDKLTGWFGGGTIDIGTVGDKIYLQIELAEDDQSILNIDIRFGPVGPGTDWDVYPDPIGIDTGVHGPYQHYYWQIIAEITDLDQDPRPGEILTIPGTDPPDYINLTQLLFENIVMTTGHTTLDADDPHMPLLVAIPTNWPGTDIDGNANPIPPEDNLMTPYQFGDVGDINDYSFKMLDASTTVGPTTTFRVLILDGDVINESDGSRHTPAGMGGDDYILPVSDDGDEIWLVIPHDNDWNVVDPVSINTGTTTPEDTDVISYVTIGQVFIDFTDTPPRLTPHNTVCGDVLFSPPSELESTRYSFQMFDASDDDGVKVKIIDGDVIDQDGNAHTPAGMDNDDFTLSITGDHNEVFLIISHDEDYNINDPITIGQAPDTPDDTPTVAHITLGYVTFTDLSPTTGDPHNTVCGDVTFEPPPEDNDYSFKIVDRSTPTQLRVLVYDGAVIDDEGNEHVPEDMGADQCFRDVENGDSIYLSISYNWSTGEIVEPVTVHAGAVPDDDHGTQYVEIGQINVNTDITPPEVIPHNTICGDYFFHIEFENLYSFQMFDGSLTGPLIDNPKVRIIDGDVIDFVGNVHTPNGMGNDDFTIDVAENYEIWVKIPHDADNIVTGLVEIESGFNTPNDTAGISYRTIGNVYFDDNGVVHPHNNILGDIFLEDPKDNNLYSFKLIDASDESGFKVRIIDGDVTDPTGGATTPAGMGNDDYTIFVFDGAEIWLGFTYDTDDNQVTSAWIQVGEVFSGDGVEGDQIGYVTIDEDGTVWPHNTLCGDFFFDPGLDVTDDEGNVVSNVDQVNFIGAAGIEHDPDDVNPNAVDVTIGTYVSDDSGNISENAWGIEFDGAATVSDERDESNDNIGFATVKIGEYVSDGEGNFRDTVWGMEFQNATITYEDEDNGTSFATIDVTGGMSVQGDSGFVDHVNHIQFTVASDPSAGFINVTDVGEGVAIVEIPVIPVSPGGIAVLGDDNGDTHWFATSVCP